MVVVVVAVAVVSFTVVVITAVAVGCLPGPAGGSACGTQPYFGTPLTRIVAPSSLSSPPGSSTEGPEGRVRAACCPPGPRRQTCRSAATGYMQM